MNRPHKQSAFTLIELLVVISIIVIASSILFVAGGRGDGAKLETSQRIVSGIAQGARGQALLKGARTRLIIYAGDNTEDDKKLRFFGIVYEVPADPADPAATPGARRWMAATQGTYLPEGIYFDPEGGPAPSIGSNPWSDAYNMALDYPRRQGQNEGSGDKYFYYEFNSNGTMATGFNNAWLVLRAGTLMPGASAPSGTPTLEVRFPRADPSMQALENLKLGLIFRRAGTVTMVTDPADIN